MTDAFFFLTNGNFVIHFLKRVIVRKYSGICSAVLKNLIRVLI